MVKPDSDSALLKPHDRKVSVAGSDSSASLPLSASLPPSLPPSLSLSPRSELLVNDLHLEGLRLAQARRMTQHHGVTPLQLHKITQIVDPVLTSCGAEIAVLTDTHGQTALEIARYRPHWQVTGWVPDMKSFLQLQNRSTPDNVIFDKIPKSALQDNITPHNRLRAILAPSWAHRVFSENHYHASSLVKELREMLALLPEYGQLIIQDFALPDEADSFVTLDIGDREAAAELIEFSKVARPNLAQALQGFFIETLPSPRAGITRFHLPYKWAVEFFHRWRLGIAIDAPFELTTLSLSQWAALVEQCGARVSYRAPHFVSRQQAKELQPVMRFSDAHGRDLSLPAASFTLVIEKLPAQQPLTMYERRISADKAKDILISGLRHQESDEALDVVEIRHHEDDFMPWYFDAEKRLHVLVRTHVPRPVINAVPRGTPNLDGRQWAGYLIEPLTVPANFVNQAGEADHESLNEYWATFMPQGYASIGKASVGIEYYPAPDYLVQRVRGIFLPIKMMRQPMDIDLGPQGRLVDMLAEDVLRAISSGLIPDGKLEILIARLMVEQGIQPDKTADITDQLDLKRAVKSVKDRREVKIRPSVKNGEHINAFVADAPTENLRAVRSVFVEEQVSELGRHIADMHEHDFIVPAALSTNTAVVVPIMADPVGKFLLSGEPRRLPIPHRLGTQEPMMHLPAFCLPFSVKTLDQARHFLAEQLQCNENDLLVLGPSFFAQSQISAERVYPFLLHGASVNTRWMRWFKPMTKGLGNLLRPQVEKTAAYIEFKAARDLGEWHCGFTPAITQKTALSQQTENHVAQQRELPFAPTSSGTQHLGRHPMVSPSVD